MKLFDKPRIFDPFSNLVAAQSKRTGGISKTPFDSLNLGVSTGDNLVEENRRIFLTALGISESEIASSHQVHGSDILVANNPQRANDCDAVITNKENVFAAVTVADCTPVLIYDAKNNAVAAIHAGWRGTAGKITEKTLVCMHQQYGTKGEDCYAYIGTCISYEAFEVGQEVAQQFNNQFVRFDAAKQKHFVDLKNINKQQLLSFGIPETQIQISVKCTVTNNDEYFSFRKEKGKTGRMLAIIGIKKNPETHNK